MWKSHFNDEFLVLLGPIISRLFTCSNAKKKLNKKTKGACSSPISMGTTQMSTVEAIWRTAFFKLFLQYFFISLHLIFRFWIYFLFYFKLPNGEGEASPTPTPFDWARVHLSCSLSLSLSICLTHTQAHSQTHPHRSTHSLHCPLSLSSCLSLTFFLSHKRHLSFSLSITNDLYL